MNDDFDPGNRGVTDLTQRMFTGFLHLFVTAVVIAAITMFPGGLLWAQSTQPVVSVEPAERGDDFPVVARFAEDVGNAEFRVRLSAASSDQVQVTFITRLLRDDWFQRDFFDVETCLYFIDPWEATEGCAATPGKDFFGVSQTLTFEPGETEKSVSVQILNDRAGEQDQLFNVKLIRPVNARLAPEIGDPSAELLVIIDDNDRGDGILVSVEDNGTDGEAIGVGEGAGQMIIKVGLNRPSTTPVEVTAFTESDSAAENEDYEATTRRLVFQPGQTSLDVPVVIIDDSEVERTERFKLRLTESNGAYISTRSTGFPNKVIWDNDRVPSVTLRPNFSVIREGDGTVSFDVKLSDRVAEPSSVQIYTRASGSAQQGTDYWGFSQRVTFDDQRFGQTLRRIDLTVLDDDIAEESETLEVRMVNAENATIVGGSILLTIIDDDDESPSVPTVFTRASDFREARGGGVLRIRLSEPSDEVVKIRLFTVDSAEATPGEDFYGFSQTVEFQPGSTVEQVDYTIIDDSVLEDDERISFRIKVVENAMLPRDPYIIHHIIEDGD